MIKHSWKLAAGTVLLAMCTYAACAQQDSPPPGPPPDGPGGPPPAENGHIPGPERELKTLTHLLNLTTDQQTGVKALLDQQATEMKALRAKLQSETTADTPEARKTRMAQMEQIHDETNTKIAALLDDTQKPKFAEWIEQRKAANERHRSQGDNPPPPPPPGDASGGPSEPPSTSQP